MTERKPIISQELAERIADHFTALGYTSLYSTVYENNKPVMYDRVDYLGKTHNDYMPVYLYVDMSSFGQLPEFWQVDVAKVMSARDTAKYRAELRAKIEGFATTPAITAYMMAAFERNERGVREPKGYDMRFFCNAAKRTTDQYGKARAAYNPEGACSLKLRLKDAICFDYNQEAYADMSSYLVPVDGDVAKADIAACSRNLNAFVRYADSHTGFAGSGSNYSASLMVGEQGVFVLINCRTSISD